MSEGYVYTSATDVNDLLNQIVSQAAVHGWTQRSLGGLGSTGRRGHISKGGVTVNLASGTTSAYTADALLGTIIPTGDQVVSLGSYDWGRSSWVPDVLCINASTGYDSAVGWYRQPGAPVQSDSALNQGRFSLIKAKGAIGKVHMFFYENPTALVVVAEVRAGEFYWLAAGQLEKDYEFEGGQFYGASLPDVAMMGTFPRQLGDGMAVRIADVGAVASQGNRWGSSWVTQPTNVQSYVSGVYTVPTSYQVPGYWSYNASGTNQPFNDVLSSSYDAPTGRLWIHPPRAYAVRPNATKSYVGVLPHVYYSTLQSFVGADIVTIGGQEYMIFPANWRASPFSVQALDDYSNGLWYRSNHYGSGFALRKPS